MMSHALSEEKIITSPLSLLGRGAGGEGFSIELNPAENLSNCMTQTPNTNRGELDRNAPSPLTPLPGGERGTRQLLTSPSWDAWYQTPTSLRRKMFDNQIQSSENPF